MPTLQVKLTKRTEDPWILSVDAAPNPEYFTPDDVASILVPYITAVRKIPGLLNISETTEGDTKTIYYEFDTVQNIINSKDVTLNSDIAKARAKLLRKVMAANNIEPYTVTTSIV